jgi:hypothetical protein
MWLTMPWQQADTSTAQQGGERQRGRQARTTCAACTGDSLVVARGSCTCCHAAPPPPSNPPTRHELVAAGPIQHRGPVAAAAAARCWRRAAAAAASLDGCDGGWQVVHVGEQPVACALHVAACTRNTAGCQQWCGGPRAVSRTCGVSGADMRAGRTDGIAGMHTRTRAHAATGTPVAMSAASAASPSKPMAVSMDTFSGSCCCCCCCCPPAGGAAAAAAGSGSGSLKSASPMWLNTHSIAASALLLPVARAAWREGRGWHRSLSAAGVGRHCRRHTALRFKGQSRAVSLHAHPPTRAPAQHTHLRACCHSLKTPWTPAASRSWRPALLAPPPPLLLQPRLLRLHLLALARRPRAAASRPPLARCCAGTPG